MEPLIIYFLFSVLWQYAHLLKGYFTWKKKLAEDEHLKQLVDFFIDNVRMKLLKAKMTVPACIVMFFAITLAAPFLFPVDLFRYTRRLVFGKTKLEIAAEQQARADEDLIGAYNMRAVHKEAMPSEDNHNINIS